MQISAPNVFVSQQQPSRAQKPAAAAFEPMEFKQSEKPAETAGATAPAPGTYVRPGTHIDIKI